MLVEELRFWEALFRASKASPGRDGTACVLDNAVRTGPATGVEVGQSKKSVPEAHDI